MSDTKPVLLFDGVCNLCNGFVQFILKRDQAGVFRFASLQSDFGKDLLREHGLEVEQLSTVVLIEDGIAFTHSDVPLKVSAHLGGLWSLVKVFRFVPKGFRDMIYNWVARNRYRWFGKQEHCLIPQPEWKDRFLDKTK